MARGGLFPTHTKSTPGQLSSVQELRNLGRMHHITLPAESTHGLQVIVVGKRELEGCT